MCSLTTGVCIIRCGAIDRFDYSGPSAAVSKICVYSGLMLISIVLARSQQKTGTHGPSCMRGWKASIHLFAAAANITVNVFVPLIYRMHV